MDIKRYTLGCITAIGVIGSVIGIFVFLTGLNTFQEAVGQNLTPVEYEDYTKTIRLSATNDYKRYVNEANTDAQRFHLLASRVSGWRRDEHTLVLLDCDDLTCEEKALFESNNDETIINASMDASHNFVIAFTERRIIYINLPNRIFTETPYSYSCNWRNRWKQQPSDRMFEQISIARYGPNVAVQFRFNGWTCYELVVGGTRTSLRSEPTLEINDFERYRIEMSIDRLGLLTIQSSTPLQAST